MCTILIVGAIITMTGCQPQEKATTAERTAAVGQMLTPWTPAVRRQLELSRRPSTRQKPVLPPPQVVVVLVQVETLASRCPPSSYACQPLQPPGRPGGLPGLAPRRPGTRPLGRPGQPRAASPGILPGTLRMVVR